MNISKKFNLNYVLQNLYNISTLFYDTALNPALPDIQRMMDRDKC